jgi:hypothetical protein
MMTPQREALLRVLSRAQHHEGQIRGATDPAGYSAPLIHGTTIAAAAGPTSPAYVGFDRMLTNGHWRRRLSAARAVRFRSEPASRRHAHSSHHSVIASAEPGERWLYCYVDEVFAEY